jgi:DNA modification methylase
MKLQRNHIYNGHVLDVLRKWPDGCINTVVTSPPYWALRDYSIPPVIWDELTEYVDCKHEFVIHAEPRRKMTPGDIPSESSIIGDKYLGENYKVLRPSEGSDFCTGCGAWRGSLGLEPTPELFVKHLCDIFDEIKRVLRDDGTIWVNLGDTFGGSGGAGNQYEKFSREKGQKMVKYEGTRSRVPAKSLVMIPQRFALEMIRRGWILRNTIIWHKNNPMPSSARDRFTIDFEYVYFFSKKPRYYFEQQFEALKEGSLEKAQRDLELRKKRGGNLFRKESYKNTMNKEGDGFGINSGKYLESIVESMKLGRNKRAVWTINTKSYKEAHFATYPPELCNTPISAGCPEFVCTKCGLARERIFKNGDIISTGGGYELHAGSINKRTGIKEKLIQREKLHAGYTSCGCNAPFKPGIVLDPFMGSGTTAEVAESLGRDWVGIEINPEYIGLAWKRIRDARVKRKSSDKVYRNYKKTEESVKNGKQRRLLP